MTREYECYSFLVIAREQRDRGDPVNAIYVAYATTLFTRLLLFIRNDKGGARHDRNVFYVQVKDKA